MSIPNHDRPLAIAHPPQPPRLHPYEPTAAGTGDPYRRKPPANRFPPLTGIRRMRQAGNRPYLSHTTALMVGMVGIRVTSTLRDRIERDASRAPTSLRAAAQQRRSSWAQRASATASRRPTTRWTMSSGLRSRIGVHAEDRVSGRSRDLPPRGNRTPTRRRAVVRSHGHMPPEVRRSPCCQGIA